MNNTIFFSLYNLTHRSAIFDWIVLFFANPFIYILILIAIIFLVFYTNGVFDSKNFSQQYNLGPRLKVIFFIGSSAVFAWIITSILKAIIVYPRPFIVFENIKPLFLHGGMDSFPSGHATFTAALAMSLFLINKKVGIYFAIGALFVGSSRIVAGVHFPIDILFGYIIGILVSFIFSLIFKAKFIDRLLAIFTKTL
ncbi:MAG: Phosphoesterase PA-phosphatase releated protein [Candidatus Nomurabacteria bacterium GW2011_GWF2_35_66]|uniref:Phosphoesterase PA-phosphatase releated protein n=1 Tax=Candidatus Nomurabacteria bacterium GW2011_GWE1_35_16 TaxID=1618761 RepID=A0A0G0EHH2_9BACT|nr:MAG: Phosphoesterase PA-phosphatase releated protein [Candidatus Nomurabacteria bacterium GW2011_GWF1_34_20]KKP63520.1 MAG: Phosphoesterase PA-phosphatase releated protein [Candidatus Nomurabacteria bacterium GW2011_GWE2_34_25]KKP66712.1 MAG: Phosphoesterase PA-phosphatase releated protein [Candidatus Nomurabacteria bacterium GW2011_GWE1_35_16]KKP83812.1 MAG: Phosphoesterase PA-phosphatase releated protein [Candidatus Nomurabacteria bacterium GW2011_GWF2_35_66]